MLSGLLCLFSALHHVTPHLLSVFPAVMFISFGGWAEVIILMYFVTLTYDMIDLLVMKLVWCLYSALPSPLYFGNHLLEAINNYSFYLFSLESQPMEESSSHIFPFSSRLISI